MARLQNLAKSIVKESLRPKEYEAVVVSTYPHTMELAEQVALQCQKLGADPIILLDTDDVFYGQFKNYSQENLRTTSAHCLGISEYVNAYVWLGGPKDPAPMARVPQEGWAAMFQGEQAHWDKMLEKKAKSVGVALGQVTRERARTYGFNYAKWKEMVEGAINANYKQMESFGKLVAGLMSVPVDVRVTADNGTDLSFRLAGTSRKVQVDDGVISDEDLAAGNTDTGLPAGSVWVAPVENSAEGTFVSDVSIPQVGRLIEGLAWTFDRGRVTDFTASKNLRSAQVNWEEGTGQKDMFGYFGLGLNKKAKPGFLHSGIASGTVTVGIGDNRSLDGGNKSDYGFTGFLGRGRVEIAGKTVIEEGKWVI